jgi:hypothetical protein
MQYMALTSITPTLPSYIFLFKRHDTVLDDSAAGLKARPDSGATTDGTNDVGSQHRRCNEGSGRAKKVS